MGYRNLRQCVDDLAASGQLLRIDDEVDPYLEVAEIQRRVYQAGGPAIYFARPRGCQFPLISNLFGTIERTRWIFRDTLAAVERLVRIKSDPGQFAARPWRALGAIPAAWHMLPKMVRSGPVLKRQTTIDQLPQIVCWPRDGGPFVTLPQVLTEHPEHPGWQRSNLGMYRVQLGGNQYEPNRQVGLHYQIHRGIGVHHAAAGRLKQPLRVSICVGGPPAMTVAAVMPLPEGLSELSFAGALAGQRVRLARLPGGHLAPVDADFCITGWIDPEQTLPEGPFGDHLGYYSLKHEFPVLHVERVFQRPGAVWPFTVVGRPPQEDTSFGAFIHELTGPVIPTVIPGVHQVHAVDAAGVHPLLLAIGSERYTPYAPCTRPQELLTQANAILGQGQMSLAKYLLIMARDDDPTLDIHNMAAFLRHVLARVDWRRDLHFQTRTTIDTLDYSGSGFNQGSKLVIAAVGPPRRELPSALPADMHLPDGFHTPRVALPGVLVVSGPPLSEGPSVATAETFCQAYRPSDAINQFPLVVLVDDSVFAAATLNNLLWVAFTRSDPAADVEGIGSSIRQKHWGCDGALVIDARIKPHHAPPLVEDAAVSRRVDQLAAPGGPLHGVI